MPDEQINKSLKRLYCSLLPTCTDAKINLKNCLNILLCVKLRMHSSGGKVGREKQAETPPAPPSTQSPHLYTAQLLVPSLSHPGFLSSWRRISAFAMEKQGPITDTEIDLPLGCAGQRCRLLSSCLCIYGRY